MSKLTGCNYDVNEELPQVTDPEQPDDGEFEAWLDSLNERTANGGADRLPHRTRKQLYFATLKANDWTPKPKPPALRPLWQTIQHAWQTIRCARLSSLPLHRRLFCLLFFAPGRYYLAAAILGLLVFGSHLSAPDTRFPTLVSTEPRRQKPLHSKFAPPLTASPSVTCPRTINPCSERRSSTSKPPARTTARLTARKFARPLLLCRRRKRITSHGNGP